MSKQYKKVAQLKTIEDFRARLQELNVELPIDDAILTSKQNSPLADSLMIGGFRVGNRWCIHPMEGWDANRDGTATELTERRWKRFGESGAKLIWGGEAGCPAGRSRECQSVDGHRIQSPIACEFT